MSDPIPINYRVWLEMDVMPDAPAPTPEQLSRVREQVRLQIDRALLNWRDDVGWAHDLDEDCCIMRGGVESEET